jgi:hypothetical protein
LGDGLLERQSSDGSAAARMLLPEEFDALPLAGHPVVLAASPELLLAAGADDEGALTALARRAREALDHPRAISGFVFRLAGGAWNPWLPEPGHAAHAPLKRLQVESQARDYMEQKRFLDELGRKARDPLCLASFSAMEHEETREPMSFTVWPEGLDILLPKADQVVFFQPDVTGETGEVVARAPWDRVQLLAGDLMEPLEMYPPRYRVCDFPSPERLRAMTNAEGAED